MGPQELRCCSCTITPLRESKTWHVVLHLFWWPQKQDNVQSYVKSCNTSTQTKTSWSESIGLLIPSETLSWGITHDFTVELPEFEEHILTVVDQLTKMGHFIPCVCLTAKLQYNSLLCVFFASMASPIILSQSEALSLSLGSGRRCFTSWTSGLKHALPITPRWSASWKRSTRYLNSI